MNISKLVLSFILSITLFTQFSFAQMVSTQALFEKSVTTSSKERVMQFVVREDVTRTLEEMGVDSKILKQRVASMTDEETSQIAYQIETLPAGGDGFSSLIGAGLFVFVILLITDILGFTEVFTFTKPINN